VIALVAVLLAIAVTVIVTTTSTKSTPSIYPLQPSLYPLRVSANGRYLVDRSGQPYFMAADTAWILLSALSVVQGEEFLRELKAQGYNSILAYMVNFDGASTDPAGQTAFIDGHMSDPNPAYFAQVQTMVAYAATLGIEIVAGPFELDSAVGQGYTDPADWSAFGTFLGTTFRDDPNLIWMLGGDHDPINYYGSDSGVDYTPDIDALESALQATDGTHLMTYHPHRNSSDFFQSSPWLSFNMIQYNRSVESPYAYQLVQGDYEKQPVKPTLLAEPAYEPNDAVGDPTSPYEVRRSAYWAVLSGALGFSFGASETNGQGGTAAEVVADVNQPGELQLSNLIDLFNSIAWSQLTPDYAHQVIGGGGSYGSTSWVSVAATSDHRTALAYDPSGSSLDVDLATFPASVQLQWFDPTNGTLSPASDLRLPNTGTVTVTPPPLNGAGDPDFVLIASVGDFEITMKR